MEQENAALWLIVEYHGVEDTRFGNAYVDREREWNNLEEQYSEKNNLNRAFDVIHKMFRSKKGNKTLT